VAQAPVYVNLRARGLESQYWQEYTDWLRFLRASVQQKMEHPKQPAPAVAAVPAPTESAQPADGAQPATAQPAAAEVSAPVRNAENGDRSVLPRKPLSAIFLRGRWDRMQVFLTYTPLLGFAIFFIAGVLGFIITGVRGKFTLTAMPMIWLLLIGGSLTTFPQFFLFRPDRPHLSEFMPGYIIAMVASTSLLWPKGENRSAGRRFFAIAVALFFAGSFAIFAVYDLHHASGGTIIARLGRKVRFHGENGVYVHATKHEAQTLQGIYDIVMKSSKPGEDVICYPYMPGYNVMTNRPTYLRNVYVDNATRGEHWAENTIHDFEQKHPAVVIVDDREINGTAASRFSHWGAPVYSYLKKNYTAAGKFDTTEVFVPPAAAPAPPAQSAPPNPSTPTEPPAPATSAPPAAATPAPAPATPAPPATPAQATPPPATPTAPPAQ